MGLSSSKSKQTTDQTTNQQTSGTTMPIAPDNVLSNVNDYISGISNFANSDPNQYVAGASPLQQQAWNNTGQLSGWQPQAATAASMAAGVGGAGPNLAIKPTSNLAPPPTNAFSGAAAPKHTSELPLPANNGQAGLISPQGYSAAPSVPGYAMPRTSGGGFQQPTDNPAMTAASQAGAYTNPFDQSVIDTTLAGYDQNAARTMAQQEAQGAGAGALGGSRFGVEQGITAGQLALGRAQTEAQLRDTGFNTAAGLGAQDAAAGNNMLQFNANQQDNALNRQLQAAGLLGDQANNYDANTRADLGLMGDLGTQQRDIESAYTNAPLTQLQAVGQLSGMTPYQVLTGQSVNGTLDGDLHGTTTTQQSPSLFNQLLSLGNMAASFYPGGGAAAFK